MNKRKKKIKKAVKSKIKSKRTERRVSHREFSNIKRVKQEFNVSNGNK